MKFKQIVLGVVGLLVVACQPVSQPMLPHDQDASFTQDAIILSDGTSLAYRQWIPATQPNAVVLALHGFNDYSYAFEQAGAFLAQREVAVYAYDQRGFGKTQQAGIWPGRENLVNDVREIIALLKSRYPQKPLYVLGESMGGAVVMSACAENGCPQADGLILAAPAVWGNDSLGAFYRVSLWILAHTVPGSRWSGEDLDILATDNLDILYAMGNDPLVIKETRVDAIYGLVDLMDAAHEKVAQLRVPTLLLYGAKDEIIPPLPVAQAIDGIRAPFTVAYYEKGYHMLLRDLQRDVVFEDIVSWMRDRYKPLPSGADMGWKEELLATAE